MQVDSSEPKRLSQLDISIRAKATPSVRTRQSQVSSSFDSHHNNYLKMFDQYLERRLTAHQIPASSGSKRTEPRHTPGRFQSTTELIANEINKRKLFENTSQVRINKMLDDFKQVETYVNIKQFIQDINNFQAEQYKLNNAYKVQQNPKIKKVHEKHIFQALRQSEFKQLMESNKQYKKTVKSLFHKVDKYIKPLLVEKRNNQDNELKAFYEELDNYLGVRELYGDQKCNKNALDWVRTGGPLEVAYDYSVSDICSSQSLDNLDDNLKRTSASCQRFGKTREKSRFEDRPGLSDQKHYEEFRKQAITIEKQMHAFLEKRYRAKWKNSKKHSPNSKNIDNLKTEPTAEKQKPLLDAGLKCFASRTAFRFRQPKKSKKQEPGQGEVAQKQQEVENNQNVQKSKYKTNEQSFTPNKQSKFCKKASSSNKVLIDKKTKPKPTAEQSSRVFSLTKLKDQYSFKKPLIKNNILKKIEDFIGSTEMRQYELKKENETLSSMITQLENRKSMDFDKFKDQSMEVDLEEVRRFVNGKTFKLR